MTGIHIDLSSDTSTRPSAGMREAMARAEVGDEQKGEDPTTNALCERVAGMLGKEAAMLLPSGIMSNVVAPRRLWGVSRSRRSRPALVFIQPQNWKRPFALPVHALPGHGWRISNRQPIAVAV